MTTSPRRGYFPQYLWKLLIDHRHQRQGYGTAALDLVADYFRNSGTARVMRTSAGQGEGSPIAFYERYGFLWTGDIVFDDEVLLRVSAPVTFPVRSCIEARAAVRSSEAVATLKRLGSSMTDFPPVVDGKGARWA